MRKIAYLTILYVIIGTAVIFAVTLNYAPAEPVIEVPEVPEKIISPQVEFEQLMPEEFKTFNHGTDKIMIAKEDSLLLMQGMPTELHYKADGDINDQPSFAIVISDAYGNKIVGEISLKMLNEGMNELGYEIVKL